MHAHLAALQDKGYLRRDATKPRAIEIALEPSTGSAAERRPVRHVPLVGDVAAGTGVLAAEQVEELVPVPADMCGEGELFMVRVRGESMIDAGIVDGDLVVARSQPTAENGDIVVAGIPGEEATVKTFLQRRNKIVLRPANESDGRPRLRLVRGADLRQGRHPAPQVLTRRGAAQLPNKKFTSTFAASVEVVAVDLFVRRVRERRIAWSEVARGDAVPGEAPHIGPAELGPYRQVVDTDQFGDERREQVRRRGR